MDISGIIAPRVHISLPDQVYPQSFKTVYHDQDVLAGSHTCRRRAPFPAGTHGFLYYYVNPQSPSYPQIRFRVTEDSDPATFSCGYDLTFDKGFIWHLSVAVIAGSLKSALLPLLIHDRLIDTKAISDFRSSGSWPRARLRRSISSLSEPFVLDLAKCHQVVMVHSAGERHKFVVHRPERLYDEGSVLCRFERSALPEHRGKHAMVLRFLKIFIPPKLIPDLPLTADTTLPAEGQLLSVHGRVWWRDLDVDRKIYRVFRVLYDADEHSQAS